MSAGKQYFRLVHESARKNAIEAVQQAEEGKLVVIQDETRRLSQNAALHAMLTDISRWATWAGKKWSVDAWKVLMVSGHAIATKAGAEVLPGLEGEFVNLRESTAQMGVKRMASLLEYVQAWGASNGVKFTTKQEKW